MASGLRLQAFGPLTHRSRSDGEIAAIRAAIDKAAEAGVSRGGPVASSTQPCAVGAGHGLFMAHGIPCLEGSEGSAGAPGWW